MRIRKIDLGGQVIIGALSILSLCVFLFYFFFIGTALLGAWQLLSALINTFPMAQTTYRLRIILYWALTAIAISLLFLGDVTMVISIVLSWGIAIYYYTIYKSFIAYIAFRKELSTITR